MSSMRMLIGTALLLAAAPMLTGCPIAGTPPVAAFSASVTTGAAPLVVQFTDNSAPGLSAIISWSWNFGDGTTSSDRNPSHTYVAQGTYTVSLTVTTAIGTSTETKAGFITVGGTTATPPTAAFSATPRSGTAPLLVQFSDTSLPGSSTITTWNWSFGNGATSTQRHPAYTYTAQGTYTVSLTVTTAAGTSTETKPGYITVGASTISDYDLGFEDGFAVDAEYWQGFDDSWDTRDGGVIYYTGHEIPELNDNSYDAGYWDGVWFAYNDGYFVAYDYAFTIGFSEGYDAAYRSDWLTFIQNDVHLEWLDGGFSDGYNDGFSEGRILGAVDYIEALPYDWLDAMNFYREGEDVFIPALNNLGTGSRGPVLLYEYGTNPFDLVKGLKVEGLRSIRGGKYAKQDQHVISYRPLTAGVIAELNTRPSSSPRGNRQINLNTTWLQRIDAYNAQFEKASPPRPRPVHTVE